jgi:phosphate transport system substrate-binding protein
MTRLLISVLLSLSLINPLWAADRILLRLHGSNTIGALLGPEMVKSWLHQQHYTGIRQQTTAPQEMVISATSAKGEKVAVSIKAHGSSTSFQALDRGDADVGMASRPIKHKEVVQLARFGKMDSPDSEFVVGLDGIAVIVNRQNTLQKIDKAVLARIFSGEISNWSQLGLGTAPIHVYARDDKSGTYDTFKHLVLGKKHPLVGNAKRFESNANLSDAVSLDPNGIGFVGLPYVRQSRALAVSDGGTAAISPDTFTVATEDYALARRLFLYLPQHPANAVARDFVQYALSRKGQEVVAQTGFISQEIVSGTAVAAGKGHPEYNKLTDGAKRLSLNFRFHKGSAFLDNKARQDVKRLVEYLSRDENRGKELILIGFSDRNEDIPMKSLGLSIQRADGVADVLINEGVPPNKVRGLGPAVIIASNETEEGKEKNRRVEVWLR